MPIQYMYPEGWLIDPLGKSLLFFEKDPMNPINEGFVEYWSITGVGSKHFKYRKRASQSQALDKWAYLSKRGWRTIEEKDQAA